MVRRKAGHIPGRAVLGHVLVDRGVDAELGEAEIADDGPAEVPDAQARLAEGMVDRAGHHEARHDEHELPGPGVPQVAGQPLGAGRCRAGLPFSGHEGTPARPAGRPVSGRLSGVRGAITAKGVEVRNTA